MADKVQQIKEEIERLKSINGFLPIDNHELCDAYRARGYQFACDDILQFINSLPEETNEDLEEEFNRFLDEEEGVPRMWHSDEQMEWAKDIAHHFAEWQKQQSEKQYLENARVYNKDYPNDAVTKVFGYGNLESWEYEEAEKIFGYACELVKQQMLKDSVECTCHESEEGGINLFGVEILSDGLVLDNEKYKVGDRVKVFVIKEN